MDTIRAMRKQLETEPIICPVCGETSDSIKSYTLPDVTFAFVAYRFRSEHHIACAKSMKKIILEQAGVTLIKTNVMWPIYAFPRLAVNLARCFVKGHSEDIIDELQLKKQQKWK